MAVGIEELAPIAVPCEVLDHVRGLYDAGRYLGAHEAARSIGPLGRWSGTEARLLAARLAGALGGRRLGLSLILRAWRDDPADPEACFYRARSLLGYRGPLEAWRFLKDVGPLEGAAADDRADWLATHAIVLGGFRDFDAAERYLAEAERLDPESPWLRVERASLLEMEDRYGEALEAARGALELRPWYRPGVQTSAHLLQLLGRESEAIALLEEASGRLESGQVAAQLAHAQLEGGRHADALRTLDRFVALSPLLDAVGRSWVAGRRSDAAYHLGDLDAAVGFARESGGPFHRAVADRLEAARPEDCRVRLAVGFVRQHHMTCAPATLAALAAFWGKSADHLEIAGEICYDGTPDYRERSWAEANGWTTREFTVTWDAATALLDRGIPFTLTTVETQSAHLQAVIGYDARRGTLLIRDPGQPHEEEALAGPLLERYRSVGPRGHALVPRDQAGRLDGLDLPESGLYDHLYRLQLALLEHDRAAAVAALDCLRAEAPGHRLAHHARRLLAGYDADAPAQLLAVEALRAEFPEDVNLRLSQLSLLRDQGRRDELLAAYAEACAELRVDPIVLRQYAHELLDDARRHGEAGRLARRALRVRPTDAASILVLARIAWEARRLDESLELHRVAACLEDKDERLARAYFHVARHLHREDEPLRLMQERFRRFAAQSPQPARTLSWALSSLERAVEGRAILEQALELRPGDGELMLHAAQIALNSGELERAADWLERANGHCRRGDWLRGAAALAEARADLAAALSLWREVLEIEPSAIDANREAAALLAQTESRSAAVGHLERACAAFPHNYLLRQALIEWLRGEGPGAAEPPVRTLLEDHPADAWAHRELALALSEKGRHDEAAVALEVASALEPASTFEASVRGIVLERAGRIDEAFEAFREAIRRDVDNIAAADRLIDGARTLAERRDALAFVARELERQVTLGDGLLRLALRARGTLGDEELLSLLVRGLEARPDLWHAWSALIHEHLNRGEHERAEALARQAVERFPLLPRVWIDLADACAARGDHGAEHEALERALRIGPGWGFAARKLAHALERDRRFEESRAVLERAIAHAPLDPSNHGFLAETLWHLGEKDDAIARISRALGLNPGYEWAWGMLRAWSHELDRPGVAAELAREICRQRGGDGRAWLALARVLDGPEALDERLDALDRAAALAPHEFEPYDLRAELLAEVGRFDEAQAACLPTYWGEQPPTPLLGRAAWIQAMRGDEAGAMARMRAVLDANPDYAWGWRQLVDWARRSDSRDEYLKAAEGLATLEPGDAAAHAYLGEARERCEDREGARRSYRRALELDPGHRFAMISLFDLELAADDPDAAGKLLEAIRVNEDPDDPFVLAREVQWRVARTDREAAGAAMERLCAAAVRGSDWPWTAADQAFREAGWRGRAEAIYLAALARPGTAPPVGELWVRHWTERKRWKEARRLKSLLDAGGPAARRALETYVTTLGEGRHAWRLTRCLSTYRETLRAETQSWALAGYALATQSRYRAGARWMADWAGRRDALPWMLANLAICLRAVGRDAQAHAVSRRSMELPDDDSTPKHLIWLALDELIAGRPGEAAARVEGVDIAGLHPKFRFLHGLALLLIEALREGRSRRDAATAVSRAVCRLRREAPIHQELFPSVSSTYRGVVRRLARELGPWHGSLLRLELLFRPPLVR